MSDLPAKNIPFMDAVKEKIKNSFIELIPEESWNTMVETEVKAFFEDKVQFTVETEHRGYNQKDKVHYKFEGDTEPTMFRTLVWDMCVEKTREHLRTEYTNNLVNKSLELTKDEATGKMTNLIEQAVPMAMNQYFTQISQGMMLQMQTQINNIIANNNTY